jgi:ADP-heptose:LPS heptosyltransferase
VRWLGERNSLPLLDEPFTPSANRILTFLGYKAIPWTPQLLFSQDNSVFEKHGLIKNTYLVFHITPSGWFRSLPAGRWNEIIKHVLQETDYSIVFTGSPKDALFIKECLEGIDSPKVKMLAGVLSTGELLTVYQHAHVAVVVQTGNGLIVNMQHVKTVIVNIKGTTMFDYTFNKQAINLHSPKDCTCNPFETECTVLPYNGRFYMACIFNLTNEEIIRAIMKQYNER